MLACCAMLALVFAVLERYASGFAWCPRVERGFGSLVILAALAVAGSMIWQSFRGSRTVSVRMRRSSRV